jgi:hypothetical protein
MGGAVQNLVRALGRDNRPRLLLTLDGWAVARADEIGASAKLGRSSLWFSAVSFS